MRSAFLSPLCAVGLMAAVACGSGDGGGGTEPPTPSISLSASPAAAIVVQGGSTQTTATLTRSGGFTGAVTFSVEDVPAGVTGALSNVQTSGGTTTATVTIQVGAAVEARTYTLTVRATGSGVSVATATFQLTVTQAPSIALSLTPAGAISVEQGKTDNSKTVTITRVNYTGPVTLTAEGLPNGVTASFAGNPVTGASAVMTLTASAGAVVGGPVTATIRGTGPSTPANLNATTTFQVTVTAAAGFTLALTPSPATVALPVGTQDNTKSVRITRNNFTAPITLSVEGLPNDVTAAFVANPVTGNFTLLTLTAEPTAVVSGPITITIRGTGAGLEATTTLTLTVDPPIFTMVAPGERHTCARATNNAIYCWGRNVFGQLGIGAASATPSLVPVKVTGGLSFKAVHTGGNHACGITITVISKSVPTLVPTSENIAVIGVGQTHVCMMNTSGAARCWGSNANGRLGDGTTIDHLSPGAVSGGHVFSDIRIGEDHSCGIRSDGKILCWGSNQDGRLGDGTTTDRSVPTLIAPHPL